MVWSRKVEAKGAAVGSQLPKLSPTEFKAYNRLADHMDLFHNNFRGLWNVIYGACAKNKRPGGQPIRAFLNLAQSFCHQLTMHHMIEEHHFFPELAERMPEFREELSLIGQHRDIHRGLDEMEKYIMMCKSGEKELQLSYLKSLMDSFGEVLWTHLDDEVKALGAENMRKYWSLHEMALLYH